MEYQMGIKINVALLPKDLRDVAARLNGLANSIESTDSTVNAIENVEHAPQAPIAKKAKKQTKVVEPVESEEIEDAGFETEEIEDEGPTIETVIKAFQAYAKKTSREKALGVLKTFKVKSVHDLSAEQYPKVLKTLGA